MQPAGEGEDAALRAAELLDLGDDDGAGAGDGRWVRSWVSGGRGRRGDVKNSGKEMEAASAPRISVSPVARRAAMAKAMAMRWSEPESMVRAVEALVAGDLEAVGVLGEARAHGAEVFGDESDAVGLLDAKFLGVANDEAIRGVGSDGGKDGKLVDELRGEWAADEERGGGWRGRAS